MKEKKVEMNLKKNIKYKKKIKLLIATSTFGENNPNLLKLFDKNKIDISFNLKKRKLKKKELIKNINNVDCVIAGTEAYDNEVINNAKNLKLICRLGVGTDSIDLNYCKKRKVKVLTSGVDLSNSVAEQALSLIFASLKKTVSSHLDIKNKKWKKNLTNTLFKKKIGIVGLGKIGKKVIKITKHFNLDYYYYDIKKNKNSIANYVNLKKLFMISDIVTIHTSSNINNKNFINEHNLKFAKKNLILVNTSRGDVINENHLYNFLKKNPNASACLDVFKTEPYNGKLINLNNVILSPHLSSYSKETREEMELFAIRTIIKEFKI